MLLSGVDVIGPLKEPAASAPPDFALWLEKHLDRYDLFLRPFQEQQEDQAMFVPRSMPSVKCWNEQCDRYIYGFASQKERDSHSLAHKTPAERYLAFPPQTSCEQSASGHNLVRPLGTSQSIHLSPSVQADNHTGGLRLPAISPQSRAKEKNDSSTAYTPHDATAPVAKRRSSDDSDIEPLLPPLKRSKTCLPRLESIGELQLFPERHPCLQCRIAEKQVRHHVLWPRTTLCP